MGEKRELKQLSGGNWNGREGIMSRRNRHNNVSLETK